MTRPALSAPVRAFLEWFRVNPGPHGVAQGTGEHFLATALAADGYLLRTVDPERTGYAAGCFRFEWVDPARAEPARFGSDMP